MSRFLIVICLLPAVVASASGQEIDSVEVDTLESVIIRPCDTCWTEDTTAVTDTLSDAQRALVNFEKRRQQMRDSLVIAPPGFSFYDSLITWFGSLRLNVKDEVSRSFIHDAGDYFRSDPAYFSIDYQVTPMRKTVQPFGLSGDRMDVINNGMNLHPFEHIVQPDGMIDFNDLPTALDHDIYLLSGPTGIVFGGEQAIATLVTEPKQPDGFDSESAFYVDRGSWEYSYARAKYSKKFVKGRHIDLSIGYRKAEGLFPDRSDNAYHYRGTITQPLGGNHALRVEGALYDRDGPLHVQPDYQGAKFGRERQERSGRLSLISYNDDRTGARTFSYFHNRQVSRLQGYFGNFNYTSHGLSIAQEFVADEYQVKFEADGNWREYDDSYDKYGRVSLGGFVSLARKSVGVSYAARIGAHVVDEFRWLPVMGLVVMREREKSFVMASVGYAERVPTLYELNLRRRDLEIYGSGSFDYADHGNPLLRSERQLTANLRTELGQPDNAWVLSLTGGHITDGIDWKLRDSALGKVFSPVNGNIDFFDATFIKKIALSDFLRFKGGGSYHLLDYAAFDDKAYSPEYQAFGGMELHVYWPQRLIHFFAYGELVYVGPYDGYEEKDLGQTPIFNACLSFKARSFRFHWTIQNVLQQEYSSRDYFIFPGQYHSWGFTWDFLN